MGLAYTVYSYVSSYDEAGVLSVYAGVNTEKYLQSVEAIEKCIADIKTKDISEEEFIRGKEQMISSQIFSQESTSSQMLLFGKELLYSGRVYDYEERVKRITSVTLDNVKEAVEYNFGEKNRAVALVGAVDKPI